MFGTKLNIVLRDLLSLLPALCLLMMLPACAPATTTPVALSSNQKAQLIPRLQAAKNQDSESARDPCITPVAAGDFLLQMNKADRAIKELTHGFDVSPQEMADALWIPPKSISPQERQRLIQQLQEAWREDDHNEQEMLNDLSYSNMDFPADTVTFDLQKERVDDVVKDLEIDEEVPWSIIKEALHVPPAPY